ncbi:MAG: c-type cytochrome [Deltaproteobacteria bacterium]|nr:c-type cytochrome [Deltaproteobacteria bacterium]
MADPRPALDLERDARRLSAGLLGAASLLFVALAVTGARGLADRPARAVEQQAGALDEPERCLTCHPAGRREARPGAPPHPHREHLEAGLGCVVCHGGIGRATRLPAAHARAPDTGRDPLLLPPGLEAACGRCHPPGVAGSETLARGAALFLRLGCAVCHPPSEGGRGGDAFGPDLRARAFLPADTLRRVIREPASVTPGATMPAFERSFGEEDPELEALVLYLTSLALPRPRSGDLHPGLRAGVEAPCTDCHAGPGGRASGRRPHRCVHLLARKESLRCEGCHAGGGLPAGERCPRVAAERGACVACHDGVREVLP